MKRIRTDVMGPTQPSSANDAIVPSHGERRRSALSDRAFQALTDNAPDAIARLSRVGSLLDVNRVMAKLFAEHDAAPLVGRRIVDLGLPADVAASYLRGIRHTFRHGGETAFDFHIGDDGPKHYAVRIVPELDADGTVVSALAITYDVTRRMLVEQERDALLARERAARERAEAAARARDQFLAIVSHELRSPLNGIQSWSYVLENQMTGTSATPLARRALEGIRSSIEQQVVLIEQLLEATVAMTGNLRIAMEPLSIREAIEAAVARVRSSSIAKDVALHVDMRLTDERMTGERRRIEQIVGYLLSNAVKFTPKGGSIWLSARPVGDAVVVVVRDDGRGLPPDHRDWLFEPFRQEDSSNTRLADGIGLGLALARRFVELHGGVIDAESPGPNLGTTFTVSLPLRGAGDASVLSHDERSVAPSHELSGLSVLVVDDQIEAREALSALLGQYGAQVAVAASSGAALDEIGAALRLPDIVVCDIAMPDEDGYAFVRRLRALETSTRTSEGASAPHTPVIALSAFAEPERDDRRPDDSFDAYLAKPVAPKLLRDTLTRFAPGVRTRPAA